VLPDKLPGIQLYVVTPVPPNEEEDNVTVVPTQITLLFTVAVTTNAVGCVTLKVCAALHPLASVTVHVHDPAVNPVTEAVPSPVGLPGVQLYV
jgi:hypothetical protein